MNIGNAAEINISHDEKLVGGPGETNAAYVYCGGTRDIVGCWTVLFESLGKPCTTHLMVKT